jgi:hypothetical protein
VSAATVFVTLPREEAAVLLALAGLGLAIMLDDHAGRQRLYEVLKDPDVIPLANRATAAMHEQVYSAEGAE